MNESSPRSRLVVTKKGMQKAKPMDPDVIAISTLDDGTKSTISTMFMGRCDNDAIKIEGLYDIVREVNLNPERVIARMSESEAGNITLDVAMLVIGRLMIDAKANSVSTRQETVVVGGQGGTVEVYLKTPQYLWHKLPCVASDPDTEYRWERPSCEIQPKLALMVCVTVLMLVTVIVLSAMMIVVNGKFETDIAEEDVESMNTAANLGGSLFLQEADRIIVSRYLAEGSVIGAGIVNMFANMRLTMQSNQLDSITDLVNHSIIYAHKVSVNQTLVRLRQRVESIRKVLSYVASTHRLKFAAERLLYDHSIVVMVVRDDNATTNSLPLPKTGFCSQHIHASPCMLAAKAESASDTLVSGEGSECGVTNTIWAGTYVPLMSMTLCMVVNTSASYPVATDMISEIVTEVNDVSISYGRAISFEVGTWKDYTFEDGTTTPLVEMYGGRNRTVPTCLVVDACSEQFEFFVKGSLTAQGTINSGNVMGVDVQEWSASYTESTFRDRRYIIGAQVPTVPFAENFKKSLFSSFNKYPISEASVLIGSSTGLGEVEFLPTTSADATPTSEQKGLIRRAREDVSGSKSGIDTELPEVGGQSFYRGYAPALGAASGVLTQLTSKQYTAHIVDMMMSVTNILKTQLPLTADVLLFQASTVPGVAGILLNTPRTPCDPCHTHEAAEEAFNSKSSGKMKGTDVNGVTVLAHFTYYPTDPPVVLVVQESTHDLDVRKRILMTTSIIIAIVTFILIQIIMLLMTRRVLNQIEGDYERHKQNIEDEKQQFGDLVKDVMPPMIAKKIMSGTRLIAETHPQLTFFFSDIVGSTETSKTLNNKQLVRMLGYTFMLEDEIASYFGIHKIKTIGDAYFAVSGLEGTSGEWTGKNHQVYRMVSFACLTQQLFGPGFSHYPEKTDCFREAAGLDPNDPVESMRMVRLRMGIHTGPAVAGVVDVGRAPHFDCFGPSVNLASRMESTSTAGRVQISGPCMDTLSAIDKEGLFEFETPRKTLVKGYGTMVTYLVKSTNLKVPEKVLSNLFIEKTQRRHFFAGDASASPRGPSRTPSSRQGQHSNNEPVTPATSRQQGGSGGIQSPDPANSLSLLPKTAVIANYSDDSGSMATPRSLNSDFNQPMPLTNDNTPQDPAITRVQPFYGDDGKGATELVSMTSIEDVKKPHMRRKGNNNNSNSNSLHRNGGAPSSNGSVGGAHVAASLPGLAGDPFDFNIALPPPPPDF